MRSRLLLPLLALLVCACDAPQRVFITDDQGRALVLHGTNFSSASKGDPLRVPSWAGRDDVLRLSEDWGFNLVRYLILWDAIEPVQGTIDQDYLDRVEQYLDWLHEAGVRVVLDMHQDVYSSVFCCDGAPVWAVRDDDLPFTLQSPWFVNYFQPAVIRAWDNFWAYPGPHSDLQDSFAAAWAAVAARFGSHPAVLGYDILNEPSPGSSFEVLHTEAGIGAWERDFYAPFLQRVIDAIRSADPDGWIFFEPSYGLPAAGQPSFLPRLDDPREGERRLGYFPHLYSISLEGGGGYGANDPIVRNWSQSRAVELERHETPLLIGEFGVTDGLPGGLDYLADVLDLADRLTSGWTVWDYEPSTGGYSFIDGARAEKPEKLALLDRPYPRAVAGRPSWIRFVREEALFAMAFRNEPGATGVTEIHVPERHYPAGFQVLSSDADGTWSWSFDAGTRVLSVSADPATPTHVVFVLPAAWPPTP